MIKQHLAGGTLRKVMAKEILRVLNKHQDAPQRFERMAVELGVTPRTLRIWLGPMHKGGWEELQPKNVVAKVLEAIDG